MSQPETVWWECSGRGCTWEYSDQVEGVRMKRRSFIQTLVGGVVGLALVPVPGRAYVPMEKQPLTTGGYFNLKVDGNGWYHCMVFVERNAPAKTWMNGLPYTTWLDRALWKWRWKQLKHTLRAASPPPLVFSAGRAYVAKDESSEDIGTDDFVIEMTVRGSGAAKGKVK